MPCVVARAARCDYVHVCGSCACVRACVRACARAAPRRYSMALIATEMCATACWTWTMYPGLRCDIRECIFVFVFVLVRRRHAVARAAHPVGRLRACGARSKGAINTIMSHGTEALRAKYLPAMVSGKWTGTMCLTEPHCGSDLAQVKTKAVPTAGGAYTISGTKIFISCGDHDMTENIVHCVLARLPDAPAGIKGISLFLVPKRKVADDGAVGDLNGVKIGRLENKMGCHGSSTCEINFENAEGFLIGTANRGMNHMFTFINTSRLGTAVQGVAATELSFQVRGMRSCSIGVACRARRRGRGVSAHHGATVGGARVRQRAPGDAVAQRHEESERARGPDHRACRRAADVADAEVHRGSRAVHGVRVRAS